LRGVSKDGRGRLWPILRGSPLSGGEHLRMTVVLKLVLRLYLDDVVLGVAKEQRAVAPVVGRAGTRYPLRRSYDLL
jgi:hypothetical protein